MDLSCYGRRPGKQSQRLGEGNRAGESTIELSGEAMRLMVALDGKVPLQQVAERYPRVLNRIAAAWNARSEVERCLDELLLDSRGARHGFPQSVLNELATLRDHYVTRIAPKAADPWDQGFLR